VNNNSLIKIKTKESGAEKDLVLCSSRFLYFWIIIVLPRVHVPNGGGGGGQQQQDQLRS
jgi:hypothetical protein